MRRRLRLQGLRLPPRKFRLQRRWRRLTRLSRVPSLHVLPGSRLLSRPISWFRPRSRRRRLSLTRRPRLKNCAGRRRVRLMRFMRRWLRRRRVSRRFSRSRLKVSRDLSMLLRGMPRRLFSCLSLTNFLNLSRLRSRLSRVSR